jgi:ethanolamine utilization cobalamin adenosyltransferase
MSQQTTLIDYAAPMMRIETLLKDMHNLLLDNKFDEAIELLAFYNLVDEALRELNS